MKLRCDSVFIKLFKSYFEDRKFLVEMNDVKSGLGSIYCCVLALILYNILVYDFPHISNGSKSILYADDSLIYAHDSNPEIALSKVQRHLLIIDKFYREWGIKINTQKSEAICFRNASGKGPRNVVRLTKTLNLTLHGSIIPFSEQIKYLGVTFNKLFKFNQHGRFSKSKGLRIKGMFTKLLVNRHLSQRAKLLIYKVCIRPAILYGFPIRFSISPTVMMELEILERGCLRLCINANYETFVKRFSNSVIYRRADVQPLSSYALVLLGNFINRLENHENSLMTTVLNSQSGFNWSNSLYMSPIGILHEDFNSFTNLNEYRLPEFYSHAISGSNRG